MSASDGSRVRNVVIGAGDNSDFSNLLDIVVTDDLIDSLEAVLAREYAHLGGDSSDDQGYLNFLASFMQMNVHYLARYTSTERG